ncbi:uncharacterized protein J4E92_004641 [Alternaria infectoria]|uniref:uncharacterized protein n=1 Tax=Alternaria infectoria TaxID=45303 RepID=UPI0022212363|nr:uncharacterized protein J4E92_004641 [Alternaria infectoria]KAI4930808.1 hypothetical protein J4E92_004641 [Alternaria infectoria]
MSVTAIPHPSASSSTTLTPAAKPVFFWKPRDGHGYLCQWYWSKFTINDETYATAEMWMMVHKARCFGDEEIAKQMLETTSPKEHKDLGREVKGFDEKVWDERMYSTFFAVLLEEDADWVTEKLEIVKQGSYHKFTISEDAENLRRMLLATGDRELVEASPHDRIWGVGFAEKDAEKNRYRWGQNFLGRALMDVRKRLREEDRK